MKTYQMRDISAPSFWKVREAALNYFGVEEYYKLEEELKQKLLKSIQTPIFTPPLKKKKK